MAGPHRRRRAAPSGRATLADIARVADVSIASASRALSHPELVSEALCARVMAAAGDLAYIPRGFGLAAARQRCVGAVVAHLDDEFIAAATAALARELARADLSLILAVSDGTPEAATSCIAELLARGAGGIAFCGAPMPAMSPPQRAGLWAPLASLDGSGEPDVAHLVSAFSRAQALALGVRYLGNLGHVRVALLDVRDAATADSAKTQGVAYGVEVVYAAASDHADEEQLTAMLQRWLSEDVRITGVVCGSDRTAAMLLRACAHNRIAVPGELAVIGFGNTELSRHTRPTLTSLRISAAETGTALAARLAAALAGRVADGAPLAAKLVVRESTAPGGGPPDA